MHQEACKCPGCGDEQGYGQILNVIDLYKDKPGSLIQVLHLAQELNGYLPLDLQQLIADGMNVPLSVSIQ